MSGIKQEVIRKRQQRAGLGIWMGDEADKYHNSDSAAWYMYIGAARPPANDICKKQGSTWEIAPHRARRKRGAGHGARNIRYYPGR